MSNNPTPRDLDPKFKDATVPTDQPVQEKPEDPRDILKRQACGEVPNDPHEGQIVFRHQVVDSAGNVVEKQHGPMPVSEWANYSRKNGL